MAALTAFKNAQVAKEFPGYQDGEPFQGKVATVDTTGSDDKPFKIHYDDGDKEWVTLTELAQILVDAELQALAHQILAQGGTKGDKKGEKAKAGAAAAGGSRKRQQPEAAAPAAPASTGGGKKQRSSSGAAAAAAVEPAPASAAARKAGRGPQQPAAAAAAGEAAVGGAGGSNPSRPAGRAAAAAASGGAAASDSAAVSPAEFEGLVRDVCRDADRHAKRLHADARVYRQIYRGPGAASLPKMAQTTITHTHAIFTIYGSSRGGSTPNYHTESVDVLDRLAEQLEAASRQTGGKIDRRMLTRVRVYLSSMQEGLSGFKDAWNAWVDHGSLPVLTVLHGAGPFTNGGVVLEADAYIGPC